MVAYRHKVFLSYHHDADQQYADALADYYRKQKTIIDKSMYDDLSDLTNETILRRITYEHLRDSTVTVVLVGQYTWGRKWVDWEIHSSLRSYGDRTRNGLVGVYLPGHSRRHFRLTDNIRSGYAVRVNWDDLETDFTEAVHKAWNRRRRDDLIENRRPLRQKNASLW